MASANVPRFYEGVIDDVIANVRGEFIDEGVDEQALTELKMVWKKKLQESKAIEKEPEPVVNKTVTQTLQPVGQVSTSIGTSITHHLTMNSANAVPQTLLQYTTQGSGDVQKTMALNLPQKITLTVPAQLAHSGVQTLLGATSGTTAVQLPAEIASLFQSNVIASTHSNNLTHGGQQIAGVHYQTLTSEQLKNATQQFTVTIPVTTPQSQANVIGQIDGPNDTSDEDEEDDFQDNDDNDDDNEDDQNEDDLRDEDEEPLNSDDDVSEEETSNLSDIENVVVCQYDKITRSKNRWKFHLKDGIMNLKGKDFVFHKALGDSEW